MRKDTRDYALRLQRPYARVHAQAQKMPDSALLRAAAVALQSVAPAPPPKADTGAEGGAAAEGDAGGTETPAAGKEPEGAAPTADDGDAGNADFSDFEFFERMLAAAPDAGASMCMLKPPAGWVDCPQAPELTVFACSRPAAGAVAPCALLTCDGWHCLSGNIRRLALLEWRC